MIFFIDAFDSGSDDPGFEGNGFYLLHDTESMRLVVKCRSMRHEEYGRLYHVFSRVNRYINRG